MTTADRPPRSEKLPHSGELQPIPVTAPLALIEPGRAWMIASGTLDVVAVMVGQDGRQSDLHRIHLWRASAGDVVIGFPAPLQESPALILGFGAPGTSVVPITLEDLAEALSSPHDAQGMLDAVTRWSSACAAACASEAPPGRARRIQKHIAQDLAPGEVIEGNPSARWLRVERGSVHVYAVSAAAGDPSGMILIDADAWGVVHSAARVRCCERPESASLAAAAIQSFAAGVKGVVDRRIRRERDEDRRRLMAKSRETRQAVSRAMLDLASVFGPGSGIARSDATPEHATSAACRLVLAEAGVEFPIGSELPPALRDPQRFSGPAGGGFLRPVTLRGAWWRGARGPLLGFLRGTSVPLALIRRGENYEAVDVISGQRRRIDAMTAEVIDPRAFEVFRALPDEPAGIRDLASIALDAARDDQIRVIWLLCAGAALAGATPILAALAGTAAPGVPWWHVAIAALAAGVGTAGLQWVRDRALIRLRAGAASVTSAAAWERIVSMPSSAAQRLAAGEIASRTLRIPALVRRAAEATMLVLGASVQALVLLLLIGLQTLPAVPLLLLVGVILLGLAAWTGVPRAGDSAASARAREAGLLVQVLDGLEYVRVAAAEDRFFAVWAAMFSDRLRRASAGRGRAVVHASLTAALPAFLAAVTAGGLWLAEPSAASVLMPGSATIALVAAIMLARPIHDAAQGIIMWLALPDDVRRLRRVLRHPPERHAADVPPGPIRGRVEATNITFRYEDDAPPILHQVSIRAEAGEFIAITGASGSGKSTLLRILLGFERPESGSVAYDSCDIQGLDLSLLRRQFGVVLQNGDVFAGSILSNIVGVAGVDSRSMADAWRAARLAGIAEEIERLPMGMHTLIDERGASLSSGQRQRLLIARALVHDPKVLFLDEPTSALDASAEAQFLQRLLELRATRIVITHRTSTIRAAERVYVLEGGKVAAGGTFDELSRPGGPLERLAQEAP